MHLVFRFRGFSKHILASFLVFVANGFLRLMSFPARFLQGLGFAIRRVFRCRGFPKHILARFLGLFCVRSVKLLSFQDLELRPSTASISGLYWFVDFQRVVARVCKVASRYCFFFSGFPRSRCESLGLPANGLHR